MKLARIFIIFTFLLAFAFQISAQTNVYPNELKGYKFFANGKLKNLRLGVSTNDDVKKIFGEDCDDNCDYNQFWKITFTYFDNITKGGFNGEKTYIPISVYLGKLYSIALYPKSQISFQKKYFSSKFSEGFGGSSAHDGKGGGTNTSYRVYRDKYGLEYTIFDEITLTTVKTPSKWRKGDLISIEYNILDGLEEKMFIKQK